MRYNPRKIESKWQRYWEKNGFYRAEDFSKKPKYYVLVEFPYPSGDGLHVGHPRSYSALDVVARKKRMEGYNVLYPMGWDAFGLPTENYAIKTGVHPSVATKKNIARFKKQIQRLGLSFDWSREINTTDPHYYTWTQWIFLQLFRHGLAYRKKMPISWCPSCKIGLANEEVVDGKCERCGYVTERKNLEQWLLKITAYADRLIKDLENVDYPSRVKTQQTNWIGRSEGAEVTFQISFRHAQDPKPSRGAKPKLQIPVFTTRPDTLFGATYLVLAPEHPILERLKNEITNYTEVASYIVRAREKSDLERTDLAKEKTGVRLKGVKAINPAGKTEIPIWISDYVLMGYGTGAIMAVPAHDERDFEFAKIFKLPVVEVISPDGKPHHIKKAYTRDGILVKSARFSGLYSEDAQKRIVEWLAAKGLAKKAVHYKLRDWVFSRQHYWGEPIPLVFCEACKKQAENPKPKTQHTKTNRSEFSKGELLNPGWVAVSEKDLPVALPHVEKYKPTGTGESPLASVSNWVHTPCPRCGARARRETDTMPNWAGSSWYFLRYLDPENSNALADPKKIKYWMPIDWYNGGMEHTTLHLLYSRFWYKFLYDIGVVPQNEPYKKRSSHGMVLGEDGKKMSKSFGNVINPDDVVRAYGADTFRLYEMFMGPMEEMKPWDAKGIVGMYRFLVRVWGLVASRKRWGARRETSKERFHDVTLEKLRNKTIKKVTEDIDGFKFNTALSALMEYTNELVDRREECTRENIETLLMLLSPFAPHMTEELWRGVLAREASIHLAPWPRYDSKLIQEETFELVIQINGKVRDKFIAGRGMGEKEIKDMVLARDKVKTWIGGGQVKRFVYVQDRLVSIVV